MRNDASNTTRDFPTDCRAPPSTIPEVDLNLSKNTATPDDKRNFEHGEISLVNLAGFTAGRAEPQPGWRWSTDVRPLAGPDTCQGTHNSCVVSGPLHVAMSNGRELELGPGDAHLVGPGHDACAPVTVAHAVLPEGAFSPAHLHAALDDSFYILHGRIVLHCGDDAWQAGPGSWVQFPAGVPHTFRVLVGPARVLMVHADDSFLAAVRPIGRPATSTDVPDTTQGPP